MYDATKPYRASNNLIKNLEKNDEDVTTGYLSVSVYDDETNLPIDNVEVSVYKFTMRGLNPTQGEEVLLEIHLTDENGEIPDIELPVIHGLFTDNENTSDRIQYHMMVRAPGYDILTVINVQIFPDITTKYDVNLSRTTGASRINYVIIPD